MRKEYHSTLLNEGFTKFYHSSGLTIYMYPIKEETHTNAYLAVNYGSVDDCLLKNGEISKFPQGTAHFLEHMLMENSDRNTSLFANTGAMANAYCTYDRTVYYFSCLDRFKDSLEILISTVFVPNFDRLSVDGERSVIIQEIKQNELTRIAETNLIDCLYYSHALKSPIAGTEQSVRKIDRDLLLRAYTNAYYPENMVLVVTGHFDETVVLDVVDLVLKNVKRKSVTQFVQNEKEPLNIRSELAVSKIHGISNTFFSIGFKEMPEEYSRNLYNSILDELIAELLIGQISPVYQDLCDKGIINMPLIHERMCSRGYAFNKLSGEAEKPKNVMTKLKNSIRDVRETGFDDILFERCRKALIGRFVYYFEDMYILANYMILAHFSNTDIYSLFEYIRNVNQEQVNMRLRNAFDLESCAISIVQPFS